MGWGDQLQIIGAKVEDFLDAGAGVKHRGQQRVVSATVACGSIDRQQRGLDLVVLEVFDDARGASLERDCEDALTLLRSLQRARAGIGTAPDARRLVNVKSAIK